MQTAYFYPQLKMYVIRQQPTMSRQHNEYLFIKKIKHAVSMRCCIRAIEQSAFYPMMQKELLQYEIK